MDSKANIKVTKPSIMIVDDITENLIVLSSILRQYEYEVRPVRNGQMALVAAENMIPDLVLLDITMPDMDGYEICEAFKKNERLKDIPIIFVSALSEAFDKVKAFELGAVDYITKPFKVEEVYARVRTHLQLRRLRLNLEEVVHEQVEQINAAQMSTIFAMAKLAQSRDDATGKHLDRVKVCCFLIAERLRERGKYNRYMTTKRLEIIARGSALHDIGKVGIPDKILLKEGKLTNEEYEIIKTHTIIGAETLEEVIKLYPDNEFVKTGIEIARWHHERWDGKGYPDGLKGEEIPIAARIMSVADVYDALKSKRTYKEEFSHEQCISIIIDGKGTQFDPQVVEAFEEVHMVVLSSWEKMK